MLDQEPERHLDPYGGTTGLLGGAALSNAGVIGYGDDDELCCPTLDAENPGYFSERGPEGNMKATEDRGFQGHQLQPAINPDLRAEWEARDRYVTARLDASEVPGHLP